MTIIYILIILAVVILAMVVHEVSHAYVGYLLGDNTAKDSGRLTLNPLKHIDPFLTILLPLSMALVGGPIFGGAKPVPLNYSKIKYGDFGVALVAIAGPLSNFIIAFVSFVILANLGSADNILKIILSYAVSVNLGFCLFNILPIPPLDGSRLIYALAPDFFKKIMDQLEKIGIWLILLLVLLFGQYLSVYMSEAINFFVGIFNYLV